jgi:protein-L-isoaspartate(D-aspartate) O-methyltransferase
MNIDFARRQMVEQQIRAWEVYDERVLDVFAELPREDFVPPGYRDLAFADTSVPLPHGQCMLTPTVEGKLLQALRLTGTDDVLEIGTGSGFLTACIARLAGAVFSVDIFEDFIEDARARIASLDIANVQFGVMDAMRELPVQSFDAIALGGSLPIFDNRFFEWLKPGGRLFVIVGTGPVMDAQLVSRGAGDSPEVTSLFETCVPALCNSPTPLAFRF